MYALKDFENGQNVCRDCPLVLQNLFEKGDFLLTVNLHLSAVLHVYTVHQN